MDVRRHELAEAVHIFGLQRRAMTSHMPSGTGGTGCLVLYLRLAPPRRRAHDG